MNAEHSLSACSSNRISTLTKEGFCGEWRSLSESLIVRGIAWKFVSETETTFIYRISKARGFDRKTLRRDIDPRVYWPNAPWESLAAAARMSVDEIIGKHTLETFICMIFRHYGALSVFGENNWRGFSLLDDNDRELRLTSLGGEVEVDPPHQSSDIKAAKPPAPNCSYVMSLTGGSSHG